eukprot:6183515-Pleurochrysis_carterae.AAC.1
MLSQLLLLSLLCIAPDTVQSVDANVYHEAEPKAYNSQPLKSTDDDLLGDLAISAIRGLQEQSSGELSSPLLPKPPSPPTI